MTVLFNRAARVTVGMPGESGTSFTQDFRIQFSVNQAISPTTNTTECSVFNLAAQSRDQLVKPGQILELSAGYGTDLEVLAVADVTQVINSFSPPDIQTKFKCDDGAIPLRDRKINITFSEGTQLKTVVDKLADQLALSVRATGIEIKGQYVKSVSFSGRVKDALDRVAAKGDFIWSIQNRELQLSPAKQANEGRGVLLTAETGLLSSPSQLDDQQDVALRGLGPGYSVSSLLNPKIRPGDRIRVESRTANGIFKVDTVTHSGDTEGADWITQATVYEEQT